MAGTQSTETPRGHVGTQPRGGERGRDGDSLYDQATSAARNIADRASDTWDDAYERGTRYYRQGSHAVTGVDATTLSGWLIAGGIGFGLAWLLFGQRSVSGDDVARRMSESSERYR